MEINSPMKSMITMIEHNRVEQSSFFHLVFKWNTHEKVYSRWQMPEKIPTVEQIELNNQNWFVQRHLFVLKSNRFTIFHYYSSNTLVGRQTRKATSFSCHEKWMRIWFLFLKGCFRWSYWRHGNSETDRTTWLAIWKNSKENFYLRLWRSCKTNDRKIVFVCSSFDWCSFSCPFRTQASLSIFHHEN